ncbi:MAG: PilZ domain-containing protein [Methylococcales bacterium]|nr:PilZ domain-containing protein [Methylococcales bacterium]
MSGRYNSLSRGFVEDLLLKLYVYKRYGMRARNLLKVSLHGMNERMQMMMAAYLELNCRGMAYVVDELEAEVEIVDVDVADSKTILQQRLEQQPGKPIIVISLYDELSDLAFYVKKPIETNDLVNALNKAKEVILTGRTDFKAVNEHLIDSKIKLPSKDRGLIDVTNTELGSNSDIDQFLKDFNNNPRLNEIIKSGVSNKEKNRRDTVRYVFKAVVGCVKKHSFLGFNKRLPISIETVSSAGALIKMEQKLKLKGEVTLEIQLDSQKVFIIPAKIIRTNSNKTYGLEFSNYQHKLTEYLIDSGRSFSIM